MRLRFGAPLQLNQAGFRQLSDRGFPAHAGMDPSYRSSWGSSAGLPRTRGDGPLYPVVSPDVNAASPHTRGWTVLALWQQACSSGFPAHAGMDPSPP